MMMSDSYNHVFGQSVNPLNRNLIYGGRSGGESSFLRLGEVPLVLERILVVLFAFPRVFVDFMVCRLRRDGIPMSVEGEWLFYIIHCIVKRVNVL